MLSMAIIGMSGEGPRGAVSIILISILIISASLRADHASRLRNQATTLLVGAALGAPFLVAALPLFSRIIQGPALTIASLVGAVAVYATAALIVQWD
jgi:hypothetical protein